MRIVRMSTGAGVEGETGRGHKSPDCFTYGRRLSLADRRDSDIPRQVLCQAGVRVRCEFEEPVLLVFRDLERADELVQQVLCCAWSVQSFHSCWEIPALRQLTVK